MLSWTLLGLVVVMVLGSACSSDGDAAGGLGRRDDLTIDKALAELKQIVLETAEAVAPGLPHPVADDMDIGPTGCEDADISPHVFSTWGVDVLVGDGREPADLLPAVEDHWKAKGYEIDRGRLDTDDPELVGSTRGFNFTALAVPGSGKLNIGGDTPCVPNPELDEE